MYVNKLSLGSERAITHLQVFYLVKVLKLINLFPEKK